MNANDARGATPRTTTHLLTRRQAIAAVMAGLGLAHVGSQRIALADTLEEAEAKVRQTEAEIEEAQRKYDETQARLAEIADEFEALSRDHDQTLRQIEDVRGQVSIKEGQVSAKQVEVDAKQAQVDARQRELEQKQDVLARRVASSYKTGNAGIVDLLLSSASFDELISNVFYLDKISEADARMIDDVREVREDLEAQREELEAQKADLEAELADLEARQEELEQLEESQEGQLAEMAAKQDEVAELLASLDDDVRQLMERRDAEMLAAAEERARQERAQRAAAAALIDVGGGQDYQASASSQRDVVNACYATPSPGYGLCAMWVSQVFNNAGFSYYGGNACDMYARWCTSSSKDNLQVGMIIAVSSHPHTTLGRIYGHVGIYIGDGVVMDNIGTIRTIDCDEWIDYYGGTVTPRWGWCGGVALA